MTTLWTGTIDNQDCDEQFCADNNINQAEWPARVTEDADGRVALEIALDPADPDAGWTSPSRFRDMQPAIPEELRDRLIAGNLIDA